MSRFDFSDDSPGSTEGLSRAETRIRSRRNLELLSDSPKPILRKKRISPNFRSCKPFNYPDLKPVDLSVELSECKTPGIVSPISKLKSHGVIEGECKGSVDPKVQFLEAFRSESVTPESHLLTPPNACSHVKSLTESLEELSVCSRRSFGCKRVSFGALRAAAAESSQGKTPNHVLSLKEKKCPPTPKKNRMDCDLWDRKLLFRSESLRPLEDESSSKVIFGRSLGEGSFYEVYEAFVQSTGSRIAIKELKAPFRNRKHRQRLLREVLITSQMDLHPNLLHYLEAWQEEGKLYIATELCMMNLTNFVNHFVSSFQDHSSFSMLYHELLWTCLFDVSSALAHIHNHKVVHLDVKPANIFVTRISPSSDEISLKLGDFGQAFFENEDLMGCDDLEGDNRYIAPELISCYNVVQNATTAVDIFSLGLVLLELMGFNLPTQGEVWHALRDPRCKEVVLQHVDGTFSKSLISLLLSMLELDPSKRISAEEVVQACIQNSY